MESQERYNLLFYTWSESFFVCSMREWIACVLYNIQSPKTHGDYFFRMLIQFLAFVGILGH